MKFSACNEVDQASRDQVSAKYDADNKKWHDMTNQTAADLDQVKVDCAGYRKSVKEQMSGKCTNMVGTHGGSRSPRIDGSMMVGTRPSGGLSGLTCAAHADEPLEVAAVGVRVKSE